MKRPEPETKVVFLPSKGYNLRRATRHVYVFSENVILPAIGKSGVPTNGIAHVFKCDETGTLRRYGFEEAPRVFFGKNDAPVN